MNNLDQSLNYPTMSGLKSLELDELTTDSFISDTIDGNIIYYNLIEGNEIIVDTKLTLTNTGVISVGDYIISDIELTYLDGVSSNIQNQLNNLNNAVNNNNSLSGIVNLHTQQIQALQYQDISHSIKLNELYNRTRWQTTDLSSTIFTKKINLNNGNIGYVDQLYPNNFYVQSNLLSGNNIILNSGLANIFLQSQNIYLGKTDATTGRKSNLLMLGNNGIDWETQSSAFTENLKDSVINSAYAIASLETKTQNISSATNSASTNMSKPIYLTTNGECLKMIGNHGYISSYDSTLNTRDWYIGTADSSTKNLNIINEKTGQIVMYSGNNGSISNLGNNKINTYSTGILFHRGGTTEIYGGEIGLTNSANNTLNISSNGSNDIYMGSGSGKMTLETTNEMFLNTNIVKIGSGIAAGINNRKSNILMLDAAGQNFETQSSAFTETLKTQIGTNTTKLQNITATAAVTSMSKPLYISTIGECLKTMGDHTYWAGYNTAGTTRFFAIGKESNTSNKLVLGNETTEGIYLKTGSRLGNIITQNTNLGQNKVVIHGLGISLKRGGITLGDAEITAGEIGAIDPLNSNFYINGNSTNEIHINSGLGATALNSNMVWIGSATANANGRKSNIKIQDANGVWEIQSSAFTEVLKSKIINTFNNNTGKLEFFANSLWWVGQVYNVVNFAASTVYQTTGTSSKKNVGEWIYAFVSGGSSMFGSNGAYLLSDNPNLLLTFEMAFTSLTSAVAELTSRVIVENSAGTLLSETFLSGPRYNARQTFNSRIYYHTTPLRHNLALGDKIFVDTYYELLTPNASTIAGVVMKGKFSMIGIK